MGQRQSIFQEEQLHLYSKCTYFTEGEIVKLYKKFSSLCPQKISRRVANVTTRLSFDEVESLDELKHCPFKRRLCVIFSTGNRGINFEDFLDMMSVFSNRAPWSLKATYAFKIFDFNGDAQLSRFDIEATINCLTGENYKYMDFSAYMCTFNRPWDVKQ